MLRKFIEFNKWVCLKIELFLSLKAGFVLLPKFVSKLHSNDLLADVGGGKKPAKIIYNFSRDTKSYDGLDFDLSELQRAPGGMYNNIFQVDITQPPKCLYNKYNKILCCNTLEHVDDGEKAMMGISKLLQSGGLCYIKVPCKYAIFAFLNKILSEGIKKKILFFLFPNKKTDGFPAYYSGCSISEMISNAEKGGLELVSKPNKIYYSSYFTFFIPIYLFWRIVTLFQYFFIKDYCESYEIIFKKTNLK